MKPLKTGQWNVRTLIDSAGSDRSQRRTALVGRELGRYGIEIIALCRDTSRGDKKKKSGRWLHFLLEWTQK